MWKKLGRDFLFVTSMLLLAGGAFAATITVDSATDDGTGCTLREAVASANMDSAVGGCAAGSGSDTIVFDDAIAGSTITLTSDDGSAFGPSALVVSSTVEIDGPDDSGMGITITQTGSRRLFHVASGTLTLSDLTLAGGQAHGFDGGARSRGGAGGGGAGLGGAILNEGSLIVLRCTLTGNEAVGGEGGFNPEFGEPDGNDGGGGAGVAGNGGDGGDSPGAGGAGGGGAGGEGGEDCFDGADGGFGSGGGGGGADTNPTPNTVDTGCDGGDGGLGGGGGGGGSGVGGPGQGGSGGYGGGDGANGAVEIIIPGGRGGGGGGLGGAIFNHDGTVTVINSTLSGNSAVGGDGGADDGQGLGAAIFNSSGMLFVLNTTIYDNSVDGAAGSEGAVVSRGDGGAANDLIDNSILAGTTDGGSPVDDYVASTLAGFGGTNNYIQNTSAVGFTNPVSPATEGIEPLADNGGPTQTHALSAASDLIDAGDTGVAGGLGEDQRNFTPRDVNGTPDVGAYEFGATPPNQPPVADAGPDQTVECAGHDGTEVMLDGSGSSDPDDDMLTFTWTGPFPEGGGTVNGETPTVTLPLGTHLITLEVDDGNGETDTDEVEITIEDTTPPTIVLNGDNPLTLECAVDTYVEPGAVVTDVCDANPSLVISGTVDTATPGIYEITYTATDASDNTAEEIRTVEVVDTLPPVIEVLDEPIVLWPPNHKYHSVDVATIVTAASDLCDLDVSADDVVITEVTSDEPENATGDGDTEDDIVIADDCRSVDLRAERQGGGNGRVYTIHLAVEDSSGNTGTASFQVHVPHDKKDEAVDDGPAYGEISACGGP